MKSIHYNRLTDNLKKTATRQFLETEIPALNSRLSYHTRRVDARGVNGAPFPLAR